MSDSTFTSKIRDKAKALCLNVAFPDAEDIRTIKTAVVLRDEKIAKPMLIGNALNITKLAADNGIGLNGIEIIDPAVSEFKTEFTELLYEKRKAKKMTIEQAAELISQPLYFAGLLLETGRAKAVVGGNVSSTGDVIRAAIYTVGVADGISIVSSYFIMVLGERLLCFADCAVNPDPNDTQLADIAISSARNFRAVTGEEPKIAMLSFSTKGSASHPHIDKVISATNIVKEKAPELMVDGEMQAD
ncbi:MAG: phosphate acetyltransferase, partial [Bacteroidota bacterium]|nr:phosphate acetyltransferase [Bacteroidota bacterium]